MSTERDCSYCPKPCRTCGKPLPQTWDYGTSHRHADDPPGTYPQPGLADGRYRYCSPTCRDAGRRVARGVADARRRTSRCGSCNAPLTGANHLRKYCSDACRQRRYRETRGLRMERIFKEMQLMGLEAQVRRLRRELDG
ncbi:MAG: hypothetical protein M3P18_07350 [Actinomycetota bacterium]|nr:hypothetical protein [Actinomycetota bacterium]